MLTLFAAHGKFDIELKCEGDTWVDYHHTVEDVGITLGKAFFHLLSDKKGLTRYGSFILPMDEALILTAIDFSGRAYLNWDMNISAQKVGDFLSYIFGRTDWILNLGFWFCTSGRYLNSD